MCVCNNIISMQVYIQPARLHPSHRVVRKNTFYRQVVGDHEFLVAEDSPRQRLQKALVIIRMAEQLNPAEVTYNAGLQVWKLLRGLSVEHKLELLNGVNSQDIRNLWKIAGTKYAASKEQIAACIGSKWKLEHEFPKRGMEVFVHEGKAAIPNILGLNRYQKHFFRSDDGSIFGRVKMQSYVSPIADIVYPLYYQTELGPKQLPATGQMTDLQFNFFKPSELDIHDDDIPLHWPKPRRPVYPFEGDLTDYVRVVAPGVYVTWGWKKARPQKRDIGRQSFQAIQILTTQISNDFED
eukprot:TRINITY_DN1410_c0_g1_i8.p3 TRINITY_DN1410_c0_g1~~TRINITY_DN1410_c0_g1_i8.p3  ORF type:complete len:295 (-),score=17.82 TRINITY_DN1410_c0_g1_i8:1023-1907(-)